MRERTELLEHQEPMVCLDHLDSRETLVWLVHLDKTVLLEPTVDPEHQELREPWDSRVSLVLLGLRD